MYALPTLFTERKLHFTFNLSIFLGAPGSLALTDGLDDSVTNFENDPMSLTLELGHQEKSMKKM